MPAPPRARSRRDRRAGDPEERMRRAREAQEAAFEASRAVLGQVAARRDEVWRRAVEDNRRRMRVVLAAPLALGVIVAALAVVLFPLLFAGIVLLAGWGAVASVSWRAANQGFASRLGGIEVQSAVESRVVSAVAADRYEEITHSLCAAFGLPLPRLVVLADPGLNIISTGGSPQKAVVIATSGLLERLDRIELEGVLAHELTHVKRLDTLSGGLATALLHGGNLPFKAAKRLARWLEGADREVRADLGGVQATRYPPGLISALEVVTSSSVRPACVSERVLTETSSQWLVVPETRSDELSGRGDGADVTLRERREPGEVTFGPRERLDVLREL